MRPITRADIKGPAIYAGMRDDFRKRIIELKKPRRVIVGDRVSLVFENRHTLISQIEEMLRIEQITEPGKIQHEIDTYNEMMPGDDSLSATLFIELAGEVDRRAELDRLIGLDEHVILHLGPHPVRARFEPGRATGERIAAVQYLRFVLDPAALQALQTEGIPLAIEIDHPEYRHRAAIAEEGRRSLAADFGS